MHPYKAFCFDVFGTVVDWRSSVAEQANHWLRRHQIHDIDAYAFAEAWRAQYQPAMEACRAGRRPFTRLDDLHRENLEKVLADFNVSTASNGNIAIMVGLAKHGNLPWDAILGAEVTRAYKPLPEAYTRMAGFLGLERHEICMVAAQPWDFVAHDFIDLAHQAGC